MKKRLLFSFLMAALAGSAAQPAGYAVRGTEINPSCGAISMPSDWKELVPKQTLSFTPSEEARRDGFLVFRKHYMDKTTPYTVPLQHELMKSLRLFAVPGEYEPATFSVFALRPLHSVRVELTSLRGKSGEIALENMDLRSAVALPFKHPASDRAYEMRNEILVKRGGETLSSDRSRLFWVTVFVPQGTADGMYRGTVTVYADGAKQQFPLEVRVLDAKLESDPGIERGMYIGGHQQNFEERKKFFLDMREHGMNTMEPCNFSAHPSWKDNAIQLDFRMLDKEMKLYRIAGFDKPVTIDMRPIQAWLANLQDEQEKFRKQGKTFPANYKVPLRSFDISPKYTEYEAKEYCKLIRKMVEHAEKNNYPNLYFLAQEESTNKGVRIQHLNRFSKLLKECGVITTSWSNGTWSGNDELQEIDPWMDVRYYNYLDPKIRDRARKSGDFVGIFNHGDRLMYGFFGYRIKAQGMLQWAYIFNGTKGMLSNGTGYYNAGVIYPGTDGPLPSPQWERIREGVDDARCIYTLNKLIAANPDSPAAKNAQAKLNAIMAQIPENSLELQKFSESLDPAQIDIWRFQLLRCIMQLQKERKPVAPALSGTPAAARQSEFITGMIRQTPEAAARTDEQGVRPILTVPYIANAAFNAAMEGECWKRAAATPPFVLTYTLGWTRTRAIAAQSVGDIGMVPAAQTTTGKLFYDDQALYIGFQCKEALMGKIVANAKKRDAAVWSDDAVEIFVRPELSSSLYYQIAANSIGALADHLWQEQAGQRSPVKPWNPAIEVKNSIGKTGWNAVFRIPFSAFGLKEKPATGSAWLLNLGREEQPTPGGEFSSWAMVNRSFHETARWGMIYFDKVPAAMIAGIATGSPQLGRNSWILTLVNNRAKPFSGEVILQASSHHSAQKVKLAPNERLQLPFQFSIAKPGEFACEFQLVPNGAKVPAAVSSARVEIPEPLTLNLKQKEVAGTALSAMMNLRLDDTLLKSMTLRCVLTAPDGTSRTQMLRPGQAGSYLLLLPTESFATGVYHLTAELAGAAGKSVTRATVKFTVLEKIF